MPIIFLFLVYINVVRNIFKMLTLKNLIIASESSKREDGFETYRS